jgi:ankyrin repeat protein
MLGRGGGTALIEAAGHGQFDVVKYLTERGADVKAKGEQTKEIRSKKY